MCSFFLLLDNDLKLEYTAESHHNLNNTANIILRSHPAHAGKIRYIGMPVHILDPD
jgi:hypothetical protein